MSYTYQDTPLGAHTLAVDQPNIEANFQYLAATLGTYNAKNGDHQINITGVNTTAGEGRHRQLSLLNRHGAAPTVAGLADNVNSLLYSDNGNVFFGSATGSGAFQLTTYNSGSNFGVLTNNFTPQGGGGPVGTGFSGGWTFLPGGLILQYGTILGPLSASGTVKFPITFLGAVFNIQTSLQAKTGGTSQVNTASVTDGTITLSQFQYNFTGSTTYDAIYWLAIGN